MPSFMMMMDSTPHSTITNMILQQLQSSVSRWVGSLSRKSTGLSKAGGTNDPRTALFSSRSWTRRRRRSLRGQDAGRRSTAVDVVRLPLWSIATLPISLWIAIFSYDYVNRVPLCEHAFTLHNATSKQRSNDNNAESSFQSQTTKKSSTSIFHRSAQSTQMQALFEKPPHQIVVVAGGNESGKTRFVAELLQRCQSPIVHVPLAPTVDSLSTLTHVLLRSFHLQWLAMRHALVDILPFAGSEILVMKERFSARDLSTALEVITAALEEKKRSSHHPSRRPVIIMDGLGEFSGNWISQSAEGQKCLQRLLEWCILVTKERKLAHVVLTGNEQLVMSLTDQNKMTRGHVKVVGLGDINVHSDLARQVILQEWPDATHDEIQKILDNFGGFIHDLQTTSREIQNKLMLLKREPSGKANSSRTHIVEQVISARLRHQIERVTAAFAKGSEQDENTTTVDNDNDDLDPFLDPLKAVYSEAQASQREEACCTSSRADGKFSWSQLQLWQTLQRLVESDSLSVPFGDLRDEIFDGDKAPLLDLMQEDVLGFDIDSNADGAWSWKVKPATPAIGHAFQHLVHDEHLKQRFSEICQEAERHEKMQDIERQRRLLLRERGRLEARKASLQSTIVLGKELGKSAAAKRQLSSLYDSIVHE